MTDEKAQELFTQAVHCLRKSDLVSLAAAYQPDGDVKVYLGTDDIGRSLTLFAAMFAMLIRENGGQLHDAQDALARVFTLLPALFRTLGAPDEDIA